MQGPKGTHSSILGPNQPLIRLACTASAACRVCAVPPMPTSRHREAIHKPRCDWGLQPQAGKVSGDRHVKSEPILLRRYRQGLWLVDVAFSDVKRTFLFDTGAGITVLTPDLASQLKLSPFGRLTAHRQSGERVDMPRVNIASISAGDVILHPRDVGVWDVNAQLPGNWPPLSGVLALNAFDGLVLRIDLSAERLVVEQHHEVTRSTPAMMEVPIRIGRSAAGAGLDVFLGASTERGLIWLELDSGNTGPTLIAPHAAEMLGGRPGNAPVGCPGADGRMYAETELVLGGQVVKCPVIVKELMIDGNLGISFLETHIVIVDLQHTRGWIAPVQGSSSYCQDKLFSRRN
ncbi:MAG: hypothetical protein E6Q92_03600 [Burkholderiaceae bacterium]|nr:MAG: hypothetical protein E6Q92_03600 [Burkholderiaceae bacterium]